MKILFYATIESCWGTFFFDEKANLVDFINENDGHWRPEYMNFIPEFFGGKIVQIDLQHLEEKAENAMDEEDTTQADFARMFRGEILKVIKKVNK